MCSHSGFGFDTDANMLISTLPPFSDLKKLHWRLLDLADLWRALDSKHLPQLRFAEANSDIEESGQGLATLVKKTIGKSLDKDEQMSDWSKRPLRESQIKY